MKKIKIKKLYIIIATIVLLAIILGIIYFSTNKKVYSTEEYQKVLEKNEYSVVNQSTAYSNNDNIQEYIQSQNKEHTYQVDFYTMKDSQSATDYFNDVKNKLINESNGKEGKLESNNFGYSKFTIQASNNYCVMIKSDNTIIYVNTNIRNKENVDNLLKDLNY